MNDNSKLKDRKKSSAEVIELNKPISTNDTQTESYEYSFISQWPSKIDYDSKTKTFKVANLGIEVEIRIFL